MRTLDEELSYLLPLAISLICFMIVKVVLSQDANHPLVFILIGAIVALSARAKEEDSSVSCPGSRLPRDI
jgi:hypothetical protein